MYKCLSCVILIFSGTIATTVQATTILVLCRFTSFASSPFDAGHVTGTYRRMPISDK